MMDVHLHIRVLERLIEQSLPRIAAHFADLYVSTHVLTSFHTPLHAHCRITILTYFHSIADSH